ncbi:LysR family transcriptional regulator [Rhizobium sp. CG4]|jgi:DNA-binding transcriptional LysR family regulator|uniref:LysR family transcriptional regulator n=1 Tax=unclassified Rhizobium TaxID=2613769 RepID=UPI0020338DA1|nr:MULTISPECIES: LysR substrate-binding domain-containing protein [unclassified Rhizobium]MCM2456416.1 LysR family transcriptional regulator [Rhizobium sp. CG4]MCS4244005.1 DNA-binding transcriptional LysR family regulator [Rhizobium sp. BIGb0125]
MRHLKLLEQVSEIARAGSIRQAAEKMNITASAMNRKIQDLELEIGTPIFERRARGVRLTAAGEMFVRYARSQIADAERLSSQVEDLRGLRRGPVKIACSQALALDFLPSQIGEFRKANPRLVFNIKVMDHNAAINALIDYDVDLAIVYRAAMRPAVRILASVPQRLVAIMRDDHPLASKEILRLSDCVGHPLALPDQSLGGRQVLDEVIARRDFRFDVMAESNSFEMLRGLVLRGNMISFQIDVGAPREEFGMGVVGRPIDERDIPRSDLVMCQLRGRILPLAAASFAERIVKATAK